MGIGSSGEACGCAVLSEMPVVWPSGKLGAGWKDRVGWHLPNGLLVTHNPEATPFFSEGLGALWPHLEACL